MLFEFKTVVPEPPCDRTAALRSLEELLGSSQLTLRARTTLSLEERVVYEKPWKTLLQCLLLEHGFSICTVELRRLGTPVFEYYNFYINCNELRRFLHCVTSSIQWHAKVCDPLKNR